MACYPCPAEPEGVIFGARLTSAWGDEMPGRGREASGRKGAGDLILVALAVLLPLGVAIATYWR